MTGTSSTDSGDSKGTSSTEPVHSRHFYDGYPLCWPMDKEGDFVGSYLDKEVTCEKCLGYMRDGSFVE